MTFPKILSIALFLILYALTFAQTPPEKTWYYNEYGQKTTVKERWDENSEGQKHGRYISYYKNGDRFELGFFFLYSQTVLSPE